MEVEKLESKEVEKQLEGKEDEKQLEGKEVKKQEGKEGKKQLEGKEDEKYMQMAIKEARRAEKHGDVPVGAIIVCNGEVIAKSHNRREIDADATAHAEMLAIRKASKKLNRWNLSDCEIFVTLEPCAMCAGAIVNSRLKRVIYGAKDTRFGCGGSLMNLLCGSGLNHDATITNGILELNCSTMLSDFFKELRKANR